MGDYLRIGTGEGEAAWESAPLDHGPYEGIEVIGETSPFAPEVIEATIDRLYQSLKPGGYLKVQLFDLARIMTDYASGELPFARAMKLIYGKGPGVSTQPLDLSTIAAAFRRAPFAAVIDYADRESEFLQTVLARKSYRDATSGDASSPSDPASSLTIAGDFSYEKSYGIIGRELLGALFARNVAVRGYQAPGNLDRFDFPDRMKPLIDFIPPTTGRMLSIDHLQAAHEMSAGTPERSWAYCFHEHTRIPRDWVIALGRFEEVFFVSEFCAEAMRHSGFSRPVRVLPHGYNPDHFFSRTDPGREEKKAGSRTRWRDEFVFLFVGRGLRRKGIFETIDAFRALFMMNKNVRLVIHDPTPGESAYESAYAAVDVDNITVDKTALSREALGDLYRDVDCLVAPSYVEGFGLPLLEAKACGLPVIANPFGGVMDFCGESDTAFVSGRVTNRDTETPPGVISQWRVPDADSIAERMREMVTDPAARERIAKAGYARVKPQTWDHVLGPLIARLGH